MKHRHSPGPQPERADDYADGREGKDDGNDEYEDWHGETRALDKEPVDPGCHKRPDRKAVKEHLPNSIVNVVRHHLPRRCLLDTETFRKFFQPLRLRIAVA